MINLFGKRPNSAQIERLEAEIKAIRSARPPELYTDGAGELCRRTGSRPAYAFDSFGAITGPRPGCRVMPAPQNVCHFAPNTGAMFGRCPICREYRSSIHCSGPDARSVCPACCVELPDAARNINCVIDSRNARAAAPGSTGHLPYYRVSPQGARLALRLPL